MSLENAYHCLINAQVQTVVALPDSGLAPLCHRIKSGNSIKYIQTVHESACVGISAGLSLSGVRNLVIMENSGLRSACETIARFHLSHNIFTCYLISHRGAFGERNWWGQAHHETMFPLLSLLRFRWDSVNSVDEFLDKLQKSYSVLAAGQNSAALIAEPKFLKELTL